MSIILHEDRGQRANAVPRRPFRATGLRKVLGGCLILAACSTTVPAGSVTLSWNASKSPTVAGYKLYYGEGSGNYTSNLGAGSNLSATVTGLTPGVTYYLAVLAYDTDGDESVFSNEVTNRLPILPAIIAQPLTQMAIAGTPVTLSVAAGGDPPLSFQWVNGLAPIPGATASLLSWPRIMTGNAGNYSVLVSNPWGSTTSSVATLAVSQAVPLVTWANPAPITSGTALTFNQLNATASVPGSFAYNPSYGTMPNTGPSALWVVFTPADTADYSSVTDSVSLLVTAAIVPMPAPVLRWKLDEGSGMTASDGSGNGYAGTLEGSPLPNWITGPDAHGGLSFETPGGGVATSGNVPQVGGVQHASLTAWAYLASASDSYAFGFTKTAGSRFELLWERSVLCAAVESGGNANYPSCATTATGWHFVALTFDGTQGTTANRVAIYLDGAAQALTPGGAGNPTSLDTAANLSSFHLADDLANSAKRGGALVDVRLYSDTLTPAEVTTMYNAGAQPTPVLQWKLDEGAGMTASDGSGNGYTGTLEGSPLPDWITGPDAHGGLSFETPGGGVATSGNVPQMGGVQHASLTAWAYLASASDSYAFGFTKTAGSRFELLWDGSVLCSAVESGGNANYPSCATTATGWHFVALTFDGTQGTATNRVAIYLDGAAQALTPGGAGNPTSLDTAANLSNFHLADDLANSANRGGALVDVRLYSDTLTAAQVTTMYNAGAQPAPVLQWKLDEGAGMTASDGSGNGYTGTLEGSPLPDWITGPDAHGGLSFETPGGGVATAGNVPQMGGVQHASLTAWAYLASTFDSYAFGFTKTAGSRFELLWDGSVLCSAVESGGNANYPYCATTATGWHFVALTFDGTQGTRANRVAIYLDGAAQTLTPGGAGNPASLDTAANLSSFHLADDLANSAKKGGALADVRLYGDTLTPAQVTAMYNAGAQ